MERNRKILLSLFILMSPTIAQSYQVSESVSVSAQEIYTESDLAGYRNEIIYEKQGNRNPFIDHEDLFELVYDYFMSIDEATTVFVLNDIAYLITIEEIKRLLI